MNENARQKFIDSIPGLNAFLNDPTLVRIKKCDPAEVLGQIMTGEEIAPTCPDCKQPLQRKGNTFFCPCQGQKTLTEFIQK